MPVLTSPLRRLVAALVAALLAATVGVVVSLAGPATPAAAATSQAAGYLLKAGPKLGRGTEWMGSYVVDGQPPAYCIDYGKATPKAKSWGSAKTVPGWSTERFQRISYVLNRYGNSRSNTQGAAVNAAVNLLIGDARFASDWRTSYAPQLDKKDRGVVPLANRLVAESATHRGPYRVSVQVTRTAQVGGTAQAKVTVTSATRRPMAGVPLAIRLGNALPARALPRATGSTGSAVVDLVPSAAGTVSVHAGATGLTQSGLIRLSAATAPAIQRVAGATTTRAGAAGQAAFRATFPNQQFTVAMKCTTDCAGAPPITVSGKNSSSRAKLQVFVLVDGKTVPGKVLTLAPGRSGSFVVTVRDGNKVSLAYRWQQGAGWTRFIPYGAARVIDCPPLVQITYTVDCPCDGQVVASVRDVNGTRYQHVITVEVPGQPTRTMTVQPKTTGTLAAVKWRRGAVATVWNQNRLNGKNVGAREKVTAITFG